MIKKLLEEFKANELYMETVKQLLEEDWLINRYGHRESVSRYKKSLEDIIAGCVRKRHQVFDLVEKLEDPVLRRIFYMRFVDLKSHGEIAKEVGYCITGISKQIRKGIEYLEKLEG